MGGALERSREGEDINSKPKTCEVSAFIGVAGLRVFVETPRRGVSTLVGGETAIHNSSRVST